MYPVKVSTIVPTCRSVQLIEERHELLRLKEIADRYAAAEQEAGVRIVASLCGRLSVRAPSDCPPFGHLVVSQAQRERADNAEKALSRLLRLTKVSARSAADKHSRCTFPN